MSEKTTEHLYRVSTVVCTRNRGARAADAIRSILGHTDPLLEVVVVDQSSNDDTQDAIKPLLGDPRLRYVRSNAVGTGRARNLALDLTCGDYILYTDDDCVVAPNWVDVMRSCFESDPRVGVVFSNVLPAPFDATAGFVPTYVRDDDLVVTSLSEKYRARGIGASMAVRRAAALQFGAFDPCLGPGARFPACEDRDVAVRALLNGWYVYETSRTHVIHDGFRTWHQGKALTQRDWTGIGAACAKPVRCGHHEFWPIVAYEGVGMALLAPLSKIPKLGRPQGIKSFPLFWQGFFEGWRAPVDRVAIRYLDDAAEADALDAGRQRPPTVSIGIPVYNGADFLAEAVQDVLAQTFVDFELIISDNASEDETQAICERFAAADARIRYIRQPSNLGAGRNFNEVARLARGKYFKWLAHDDRMAPEFLERCVKVLDASPGVVLAYPRTVMVDADLRHIEDYGVSLRTDSELTSVRFSDLVLAWSLCFEVFGLFRVSALRQTDMMGNYGHGDGVLLAQLGMLGTYREIDAPLHISRRHAKQSGSQFTAGQKGTGHDYHSYSVWFNPALKGKLTFPTWKICRELYRTIWMYPATVPDRARHHATLVRWARKNVRHLLKDLAVAPQYVAQRLINRQRA